jgi:hypothetical protein
VPVDASSGQALRYRKMPEGVVIFSVGPIGGYNGDFLNRSSPNLTSWGMHGFGLWDENRRGWAWELMPKTDNSGAEKSGEDLFQTHFSL